MNPLLKASTLLAVLLATGCASVPDVEHRLQGLQFHPNMYVVQASDTIDSIAYRYQLSPMELVSLNPGLEKGPVPGQRINVVPGTELSEAVRQGRSRVSQAQGGVDSRSMDDYTLPDERWAGYGTVGPRDPAGPTGAAQPGSVNDAYAGAAPAYPGQAAAYPPAQAQTAPVFTPPPAVAQPLPSTLTTGRQPGQQVQQQARQPVRQSFGQQAGQQATGQPPQVTSEIRASSRLPDRVAAGGEREANRFGNTANAANSAQAPGQQGQGPNDAQLLSGANQPEMPNEGESRAEQERLAMVSPDANGWPREEIVPDTLDFEPVNGRPAAPAEGPQSFSGRWAWPTDGQVVRGFQPDRVGGQGVDIAGVPGQDVRAAMDGTVVYAGRDLSGQGNLIILRHPDNLLSTYSHARNLYVAEDDVVRSGDSIASLGANENEESVLGFEIRRDGNPLNPMEFLPVP